MHLCNSSFVLSTHSQSILEYFEHHYLSSSHTYTIEDSLPVYSHESNIVLTCDLLDSFEAISTHGALAFTRFDPMTSLCSYMITCTHPLCVNEVGYLIHFLGLLFRPSRDYFIFIGLKFKSLYQLGDDYNS